MVTVQQLPHLLRVETGAEDLLQRNLQATGSKHDGFDTLMMIRAPLKCNSDVQQLLLLHMQTYTTDAIVCCCSLVHHCFSKYACVALQQRMQQHVCRTCSLFVK
jgi:hypothetical protein